MGAVREGIAAIGVVPVIKLSNPERDAAPLARALCAGGVPVAEVTFRAAGAARAIRIMSETCPEMIVPPPWTTRPPYSSRRPWIRSWWNTARAKR